jgi:proline iminopeptidase
MTSRHSTVKSDEQGFLDAGDGNHVYWQARGNAEGKPALIVHGGPGSGTPKALPKSFDADRYRIISFDQRGCGRSTPHASDPATDMSLNTTDHLLDDMERLREHLGVDRWLLFGGSWGSTLALAYAERHPERVSEMVLAAVTTSRRYEIDWLYQGVGRFFPEQWQKFCDGAPPPQGEADPVPRYARLMENPDLQVRSRAALQWCAWEDAVLSSEAHGNPNQYTDKAPRDMLAFVRICSHYFAHGVWLEEGQLIRDASRLAGIPGVLIHGRLDMSAPLDTAWDLARSWPGAELLVVDDAGHKGSATMSKHIRDALERFSTL